MTYDEDRALRSMTETQLYFAVGIPTLAVLVGILINSMQFHGAAASINARISSIETSINGRISSIETSINARLTSVETRLEMLIGKVMEIDTRLTRLEERWERGAR
jgi:hypothetical protein